ncbi:MAG: Jag N-terminal domain-containing protein, partial [Acidimicrobiales bacterium]
MEWVEASGKSLLEAQDRVLDLLGVAEDDAEFIVLAEPKPGLFGRMRGEARVQGRVRPVVPPPKRGRRQRSDRPRNEHRMQSGSERKNRPAGGGKGRSGSGRETNPPAVTSRGRPGGSSTMDGGADGRPKEAPASVN